MNKSHALGIATVAGCTVVWLLLRNSAPSTAHPPEQNPAGGVHAIASVTKPGAVEVALASDSPIPLAQRRALSDPARLRYLENAGRVPADADWKDWDLAGRTSWWGKPLDPKSFWTNRTVWLDQTAKSAAGARGRAWPPIPYDEPTLKRLYPAIAAAYPSDTDAHAGEPGLDSPNVSKGAVYTSRERAFWCAFIERNPRPPEVLERAQLSLAEETLRTPRIIEETKALGIAVRPEVFAQKIASLKQSAASMGLPPEALSDNSLFWAYVLSKKQDYDKILGSGRTAQSPEAQNLLGSLLVEPKWITEPATAEEINQATTWRIAYLRRLRNAGTDESYINSYLIAWKLSADDVFGK